MKNRLFYLAILVISTYFVSAQEIRVNPNTCLKLETGSTLDISAGNLIIESNSTGDASLIDFGTVYVQTSGAVAKAEFESVPHPSEVTRIINEMISHKKKRLRRN